MRPRTTPTIAEERYAAEHCPHRRELTEAEWGNESRMSCIVIGAIVLVLVVGGVAYAALQLWRYMA